MAYVFTADMYFITDVRSHYNMHYCCGNMLSLCHYSLVVLSDQICPGVSSKKGFSLFYVLTSILHLYEIIRMS